MGSSIVFNPFTGTFDFTGGGGGGSGTVTQINTTSPITGGPITTTGTIGLDVSVDHLFTHSQTITPSAAGQGGLTLSGNTETASTPVLNMTQTWNNAGVAFTAVKLNVTDTASATASLLVDLQVAATPFLQVRKDGRIFMRDQYVSGISNLSNISFPGSGLSVKQSGVYFAGNGFPTAVIYSDGVNGGVQVSGTMFIGFTAADADATFADVTLARDGVDVLALRRTSNAQIYSIYNTYTSSTSFERLMLDWQTTANVAQIYTQKGSGGGTARVLQLNYGGTTTAAISIPITSGTMTFGADPTISGFGAITYTTGSVALTGQTADIADTAITINGTGLYSLTYYLLTTTADAAAGTVKLAIKYTDNSGAKEIDSSAVILTATTGFDAGGPVTVRTNSGTVTYGTTHTGIYGTSAYALYISLEKLQ